MLRSFATACPLYEARSTATIQQPLRFPSRSQPIRLYTQAQRDRIPRNVSAGLRSRPKTARHGAQSRPSRMVLSNTVASPPAPSAARQPTKSRRDMFTHLNRIKAPPRLVERERRQEKTREKHIAPRMDPRKRVARHDKQDPFHALKMQRSLQDIPYGSRGATKKRIDRFDSFEQFPLLQAVQDAIKDALPDLEYRQPTPAQAIAIPTLLGSVAKPRTRKPTTKQQLESFLLAAETGSGKTLAYLLPILDAIKREEAEAKENDAQREAEEAAALELKKRDDIFSLESPDLNKAVDPARPRAIILVPSAELVAQVGAVAKSLSHTVKIRAAPISAKNSATVIRSRLFNEHGVDVVVSTPPLLASIVESQPNILARVTHLVCDEADSLFDRSFKPSTTAILARATPSLKKLVLCSATIPQYLDKYLASQYPDMHRLVTPNLHAIPRRVQLGVVDVSKDPYRGNKMLACADTIWQIGKAAADYDATDGKEAVPIKRILVFVNEREATDEVAQYLVKKGIDAMAFHRDTDPNRQAKLLASFTGGGIKEKDAKGSTPYPSDSTAALSQPTTSVVAKSDASSNKRQLANTKVIVTTDLGSRGIDTVSVRHVILYDVPHTTIDFIHRLGRTGRMGRRGRGIVLVGPGDRGDVVKEVRDAMFRGEALI